MNTAGRPPAPRRWWRRSVGLLGSAFIVGVIALAGYDTVRGRELIQADAREQLEVQARVVAEQTARSMQAVDGVLRHVVQEHAAGLLKTMTPEALHRYLRDQSVGLTQVDALAILDARGRLVATSGAPPESQPPIDRSEDPRFGPLRRGGLPEPIFSPAGRSEYTGVLISPVSRRLVTRDGRFDGVVSAAGRVEYFQRFYADVFREPGTRVALLLTDGTLLARYPAADDALGRRFPQAAALAASAAAGFTATQFKSELDGGDVIAGAWTVPDYPLVVVIARDTHAVLAAWRSFALASGVRTLALAVPAALLLALALLQLGRLDAARASLEVSQHRYALAAAGADDGIWDWDFDAGVGYESARSRALQGLPREPETQALAALQALPTYPEADAVRRRDAMAAHLAGSTAAFEGEYRVQHADGSLRWVRVRGLCVRDAQGRPLRMAGSVSDIDARKRAEERYELAVLGSNEGLWDHDMIGGQMFLSPRAQAVMFGESGETHLDLAEWRARMRVHPDDDARVEASVQRHLSGDTPFFTTEFRVRHAVGPHAGGWRWVRQRGIALADADARLYRMAGSVEDISERKQQEAAREGLEQQLRQAQKLEAIGTLAGGIAHDFNNMLAAIVGFAELAQRAAPEGSAQRAHLDASLAAGARAKSLVERILAFSRSGIGERAPVHVQSVVAEALDGLAATLPAGVAIERRLEAGDAAVIGDPTQVHQVVMNLGGNAVQAVTAPGTVQVVLERAELDAPRVTLTRTLAPGRYLRLAVSDSGIGIEPRVLERIFDPFFTTKEVGVGTGLGLSLVHGITTELGGGIDVSSAPGAGSVFTVWLPTVADVAAPLVQADEAPLGSGQVVMLVDDERPLLELGEEGLAELGYEPAAFGSAQAALAALRAEPGRFDVVVSDEAMPGMTGSQFVAELRALRPGLPVIMTSGFVTPELQARARELGVLAVLSKPLAGSELARVLAQALAERPALPV